MVRIGGHATYWHQQQLDIHIAIIITTTTTAPNTSDRFIFHASNGPNVINANFTAFSCRFCLLAAFTSVDLFWPQTKRTTFPFVFVLKLRCKHTSVFVVNLPLIGIASQQTQCSFCFTCFSVFISVLCFAHRVPAPLEAQRTKWYIHESEHVCECVCVSVLRNNSCCSKTFRFETLCKNEYENKETWIATSPHGNFELTRCVYLILSLPLSSRQSIKIMCKMNEPK